MYHATSPNPEFRAGSSWCIENKNCCFLLGTLCYFVFLDLFCFSIAVTNAENRKKIGRGPIETPVHMLYYAQLHTCPSQKSKTHDIECFWTILQRGDFPTGWRENDHHPWMQV